MAVMQPKSRARDDIEFIRGYTGDNNVGFEFSTTRSISITDLGFFDQGVDGLAALKFDRANLDYGVFV